MQGLIGILGCIGTLVGVIAITLFWLQKKAIKEIVKQLIFINTHKTNKEVVVGTQEKDIYDLVSQLNMIIKEKKKRQQEYIRMDRELREAITNISHDLRTPLTSILGYIQLIEKDEKVDKEMLSRYLKTISGRAESLNLLVESFYELSRLNNHEVEIVNEEVHIDRIICELIAEFYNKFVDKKLELKIDIPQNLSSALGEVHSIERVVLNLFQNSLRYASKEVEIVLREEKTFIVLEIANEAGEVKEEDLPYLFDRFYMADRVRSGEGTGVGLAVVKKLMEMMSGEASVTFKNGQLRFILKWQKSESV